MNSSSPRVELPGRAHFDPEDEQDSLDLLRLIAKRRFLLLWIVACALLATTVYAVITPPRYGARATLEAKPLSPSGKEDEIFGKVVADSFASVLTEEDLVTTTAKLMHADFLSRVASDPTLRGVLKPVLPGRRASRAVKLAADEEQILSNEIVRYLKHNVAITPVRKTRLIDITATHHDPGIAALIANTFANTVITKGVSARATYAREKVQGLQSDFAEVIGRMEATQLKEALYLRSVELRKALTEARTQVKTLAGRYKDKHPKMIEAVAVVREQEGALLSELERVRSHPAEAGYWAQTLAELESGGLRIDPHQAENLLTARREALVAELEALRILYSGLSVRVDELRIANQTPDLDLRLAQAAVLPGVDDRIGASLLTLLLAATFFSTALGSIVALLFGLAWPRIESPADWRAATSIPFLGMVSDYPSSAASLGFVSEDKNGPPFKDERSVDIADLVREQVRNLRTRLLSPPAGHPGAMLITSPLPAEGKSSLACALSYALQQISPSSVVLVDLDLHQPSLHEKLGFANDLGTSELILQSCSIDEALVLVDGVWVLGAGSSTRDALGQFGPAALDALICQLRERFSYVVVDGPPVLVTADTRLLASLCDDVLLVANALTTPPSALRQSAEELRISGCKIQGGVLNQVPRREYGKAHPYRYLAQAYGYLHRLLLPQLAR